MTQSRSRSIMIIFALAALSLILASTSLALISLSPQSRGTSGNPETREFTVVTSMLEFNDTAVGIPHDVFYPSQLIVNEGDKVTIHFYNTEDEPERHTFTLPAYGINVDLGQGEKQDITFVADKPGVFQYYCTYHLPTMVGELIVLPRS